MSFWRIWGFDDGPHYDTAIIEADTAEDALDHLESLLEAHRNEDGWTLETVWSVTPRARWMVREFDGEYVLGAGCR